MNLHIYFINLIVTEKLMDIQGFCKKKQKKKTVFWLGKTKNKFCITQISTNFSFPSSYLLCLKIILEIWVSFIYKLQPYYLTVLQNISLQLFQIFWKIRVDFAMFRLKIISYLFFCEDKNSFYSVNKLLCWCIICLISLTMYFFEQQTTIIVFMKTN